MQRLRFKADDGSSFPDWKEKSLEDVCEYRKGQSVGDTLMSNIRPYLKKTWKADRNGVCSTDVLVFRPVNIDSDFLYCNIASEKFVSYVMTGVKGSKMPRGDKKHIMEYDIPVPLIPEQQKIAEFLSTIDAVIEKQKETVSAWEERKKGVMQKLFSQEVRFKADDGSEFPEWEEKKLGDFGVATGGTSIESEFVSEGKYKVINIGSYSMNNVYKDQGLRVNKTNKTENRILKANDLTMILNDKT